MPESWTPWTSAKRSFLLWEASPALVFICPKNLVTELTRIFFWPFCFWMLEGFPLKDSWRHPLIVDFHNDGSTSYFKCECVFFNLFIHYEGNSAISCLLRSYRSYDAAELDSVFVGRNFFFQIVDLTSSSTFKVSAIFLIFYFLSFPAKWWFSSLAFNTPNILSTYFCHKITKSAKKLLISRVPLEPVITNGPGNTCL